VPTRAFDTEAPKGTLKRFHPDISEIVDVTAVSDQMRIFDTVSDSSVTVIDVRAGLLSSTLRALSDIGFLNSAKQGQLTLLAASAMTSKQATLARDRPKMPRVGYLGNNIGPASLPPIEAPLQEVKACAAAAASHWTIAPGQFYSPILSPGDLWPCGCLAIQRPPARTLTVCLWTRAKSAKPPH
jgi:hypothetical protein